MKTEEDELFEKRLREMARKSVTNRIAVFTGFLGMSELSVFHGMEKEWSEVPYRLFGGYEDSERVMIRFGEEWEFPIACIEVSPVQKKFADQLGHRDFLGALMNLGIERSTIGDILIQDHVGYVFCQKGMADYIIDNLTQIRHTTVCCRRCETIPEIEVRKPKQEMIQITSERMDAVVARVYHLSRKDSLDLFRRQQIFCNGRLCENNSQPVRDGDKITVRGYGKFSYEGRCGVSKKGKIQAGVLIW